MNTKVTLSKRQQSFLSSIPDLKVRKVTEAKMLAEKQAKADQSAERYQAFRAKVQERQNQPIEFVVLDSGCIAINNVGTRRNAVLTPEKARALVKNFGEFKALVETLPESADFSKISDKE